MKYVLILIMLFVSSIANLYSAELNGVVYGTSSEDEKERLVGASVMWLNTTIGVSTNSKAEFTLPKNSKSNAIVVSYISYKKDTIQIAKDQDFVEIVLEADIDLDEIVVEEVAPSRILNSKAELNEQKITMQGLRKAACCNLTESFTTNASVDVEQSDAVSGAKQIKLLGLSGNYTQILIEKLPMMRGLISTFGLNYVPGPWMESILISKGAASVSNGYESITGQINVEYKKAQSDENMHVNFFWNQHNRLEADLDINHKFNDELSTIFMAHGNLKNSYNDFNSDGFIDSPINSQTNFLNRWNYMTDNFHTQFYIRALSENRESGQKTFFDNDIKDAYRVNINTDRYEAAWKLGYIIDGIDYKSVALLLNSSIHNQDALFGLRNYDGKQESVNANLTYQFSIIEDKEGCQSEKKRIHDFSLGTSFIYDNFNEKYADYKLDREEIVPGAFFEYTLNTKFDLTFIAGIRVDNHNNFGTFYTPRFHAKYQIGEESSVRASAGKGFRSANILSENIAYMASSRDFVFNDNLKMEEAWNFGLNYMTAFYISDYKFTINTDFYRTNFINQIIANTDIDPSQVIFQNFENSSYSNAFQVDLIFEPIADLDITTAYRLNDVKYEVDGKNLEMPLQSRHKGFFNIGYIIGKKDWAFDFTIEYNGGGRLPNTSQNPTEYQLEERFPSYFMLHAQVSKKIGDYELYLGGENLTSYTQKNPILAADAPFSNYFDSSMIWAPVLGRVIYFGVRFDMGL